MTKRYLKYYVLITLLLGIIGALFSSATTFADAISIKYGWIAVDANDKPVLAGSQYPLSSNPVKPVVAITNGVTTEPVTEGSVIYLGNTKTGSVQVLVIGDMISGYKDAFLTKFTIVNAPAGIPSTNTNSNAKASANKSTNAATNTNPSNKNKNSNSNANTSSTSKKSASNTSKPKTPVVKTYTIKYVLNGGTNDPRNPASYKMGSKVKFANPMRSGYVFKGWYTDKNFAKKITSITAKDSGIKTLYAKWVKKEKTYTITYKLSGGKNSSSNPASYTQKTATIKLANPIRAGYTFKGWYSDSAHKNKVSTIAKGSNGNKTLYAKWAVTSYPNMSAKTGRATNIKTMKTRYKNYPNGGIAIVGTSYMSSWDAEITFSKLGFDAGKIYNFAIGGDSPAAMGVDNAYINMIAEKAPHVVIINGANDFSKNPKIPSQNNDLVNKTFNGQSNLIKNLRTALKAKGVSNPKFILTTSLKTPSRYYKSVDSSKYTASKGPTTCNLWKRVDLYNSKIKTFAVQNADTICFDFEPYFYKIIDGKVRYYLTSAERASGNPTGRAVKMLKGNQATVFLGTSAKDKFHHPTKKAHEEIFPNLAKTAIGLYK